MDPATSGYGLALWLELDPSFLPSWMPQASSVADSLPPAVTVVQNPHLTLVARLSATQAGAPEAFVAAAEELVASIPAPFLLAPHQDIIHSPVKYAATDTATTGLQALAVMFHEDGCGELFALRAAAAAKFGLASSTEPTHGKYEPHMSIVYWTGAEVRILCLFASRSSFLTLPSSRSHAVFRVLQSGSRQVQCRVTGAAPGDFDKGDGHSQPQRNRVAVS
jgi:hypothetical protein